MKNYSAKNVNEYISGAPKEARAKLKEVRAAIRAIIPKAEESISWGVPFYKYYGVLAGFVALNGYVSFGLAFRLENKDRKILEEKCYKTGKKTFQIKFNQKVPISIIRKMLKVEAKKNKDKKVLNEKI